MSSKILLAKRGENNSPNSRYLAIGNFLSIKMVRGDGFQGKEKKKQGLGKYKSRGRSRRRGEGKATSAEGKRI